MLFHKEGGPTDSLDR